MKRAASIQIISDGEHVRVIREGHPRDISTAVESAAYTDPVFRASVIVATVAMFEKKNPKLAQAILLALEVEHPTQRGREAQVRQVEKILAA